MPKHESMHDKMKRKGREAKEKFKERYEEYTKPERKDVVLGAGAAARAGASLKKRQSHIDDEIERQEK